MTDWKKYSDEKPTEWEKILYVSPLSGTVVLGTARYFRANDGTVVLKVCGLHIQPDDELYWMPVPEAPADGMPEIYRAEREARQLRAKLREAESLIAELTAKNKEVLVNGNKEEN